MPLRGSAHSALVGDESPYFVSLSALDNWASTPKQRLSGCLPYIPRSPIPTAPPNRGRLLVCHDYQGGYMEKPDALTYTFNFWSLCDVFVYFSHNRITVPPSGWVNAAHRQGVKMLGTLIFENDDGREECPGLISPAHASGPSSNPSLHHARTLANLAYQRGFDGYLLNMEVGLKEGMEQARNLSIWISLLEEELRRAIGDHAQVVWYDSVTYSGTLSHQSQLNALNLPFFIPSTSIFTDYSWNKDTLTNMVQYFPRLKLPTLGKHPKQLRDVFVGVDVFGRYHSNSGGLSTYNDLHDVDPEERGLSVALFAPGWTWENTQKDLKKDWTWNIWWSDYERQLWLASTSNSDESYRPLTSFFARQPPPNPALHTFFSAFSPGVGRAWFVEGRKIWESTGLGWTDVDKNSALGDLIWASPTLKLLCKPPMELPPVLAASVTPTLNMQDAWLGGTSLQLSLSIFGPPTKSSEPSNYHAWIPVQSLAISPQTTYVVTVVYKNDFLMDHRTVRPLLKVLEYRKETVITPMGASSGIDQIGGWRTLSAQFYLFSDSEATADVVCAVGLDVDFVIPHTIPRTSLTISISLGSLCVYPLPPASTVEPTPQPVAVKFAAASPPPSTTSFSGVLTWETGVYLPPMAALTKTISTDDVKPAWQPASRSPKFLYFIVYILALLDGNDTAIHPEKSSFIGTTGLDGRANRFFVDPACLAGLVPNAKRVRFYVRGVTERGTVTSWQYSAFVDVSA